MSIFTLLVKNCKTRFLLWKRRRACRKGKHVAGPPVVSLEAAHMREPNGCEYSIKIRVKMTQCIYCNHIMNLQPCDIVDVRPPPADD